MRRVVGTIRIPPRLMTVVPGLLVAGALSTAALAAQESPPADPLGGPPSAPIPISPGGRGQEGEVGTSCPTFSWAAIDAAGYEVVVYESNGAAGAPSWEEPVLRIDLPAGVSAGHQLLRRTAVRPKVVHCNDVACAGSDQALVLVDANPVGQYTSITIGVDGLPIISYYDITAGALKVAHCSNAFCTPYFRRR